MEPMNLDQYLRENRCEGFKPVPHYFPSGDYLTYFFRDERAYEERVDERLTVYLAWGTKEPVGCKIKGVKHILDTAGDFGVTVADGEVRLDFFFFVGAVNAKGEEQARRYRQLRAAARDAAIDRRQIVAC